MSQRKSQMTMNTYPDCLHGQMQYYTLQVWKLYFNICIAMDHFNNGTFAFLQSWIAWMQFMFHLLRKITFLYVWSQLLLMQWCKLCWYPCEDFRKLLSCISCLSSVNSLTIFCTHIFFFFNYHWMGWNAVSCRSCSGQISSEERAHTQRCRAKTDALGHHETHGDLFKAADCEVMVHVLGAHPNACGCRVYIIPLCKKKWA